MYSPAKVSTNPPVKMIWKGREVGVKNAGKAILELGITPIEAQEFLKQLHKLAPDLVKKEGSVFVSVGMVGAWLSVLQARWASSTPFVEFDEAERRAAVCMECPLHVSVTGCSSCSAVNQWTMRVPEGLAADVGACGACGCHLPTKVWLAREVIDSDPREINYPSNCWMFESGRCSQSLE